MSLWKLLALAGFVSTAAPAVIPTKSYSAQILSVEYQFCSYPDPQNPDQILQNTPWHPPGPVNHSAPYQAVLAKVLIGTRVYQLQLDSVWRKPCVQTLTTNTECLGGTVTQANPFLFFLSDDYYALKRLVENWALTKTKITIQAVGSTIANPSLTSILDGSNVRFLDDGAGNRIVVSCGYDGTTTNYNDPKCRNDYP